MQFHEDQPILQKYQLFSIKVLNSFDMKNQTLHCIVPLHFINETGNASKKEYYNVERFTEANPLKLDFSVTTQDFGVNHILVQIPQFHRIGYALNKRKCDTFK